MLRRLAALSLAILALTLVLAAIHPHQSGVFALGHVFLGRLNNDSSTCMDFGWKALKEGKDVYESVFFAHVAKFQYPMSSLLLYQVVIPLGIPGGIAITVLTYISLVGTLLLSGQIFLMALPPSFSLTSQQQRYARLWIALLGLLFYPVAQAASLAQIQAFLILLWAVALYLWMQGREGWSGACIGLVCMFKPQLAAFLLWAALRRRWKFLLPMLAVIVATQIATILLFGWHNEIQYLAVISYLSRHGEVYFANQSVNGLLQRLLHTGDSTNFDAFGFPPFNPTVYRWTTITTALMIGTALILPMLRRWRDSALDLLFFGLVVTVASPIAWEHHYGYFFPAAIYCMAKYINLRDVRWYTLQASYLVLSLAIPSLLALVNTPLTFLISYEFFAGLVFLTMMALLADKSNATAEFNVGWTQEVSAASAN